MGTVNEHVKNVLHVARGLAPVRPQTLRDSGISSAQICDLALKLLYLQGAVTGFGIAGHLRLPFSIIDEALRFLKEERCLEVASGEVLGRVSYRFSLTESGRVRAREAFEQCRYVGPAPVSMKAYLDQCRRQTVVGMPCSADTLRDAFRDLVIPPGLLDEIGPAVCSGKSIFLHGPPGNGKTLIARGLGRFLNLHGGEVYVPYAVHVDNAVITLFDPTIHQTTDDVELQHSNVAGRDRSSNGSETVEQNDGLDLRWRRIRRPVVVTGGELTLEMLDLRYNKVSNFYAAPLHLKANGGVFLIDDFGRQIISPRDLLNRWILPLEERVDFLTLATGRKFLAPFEQLLVLSTNFDPRVLADDAFLRRIRHKILVGPPTREVYQDIFRMCCVQRDMEYDETAVEHLFAHHYNRKNPPKSSDPRDLLDVVQSICRFRGETPHLTRALLDEAVQRFFGAVG